MHLARSQSLFKAIAGSWLVFTGTVLEVRAQEATAGTAAQPNAPSVLVGDLGDTRKLQFDGLQHFTAAQLRGKLEFDVHYQAAARPSADREQFLRIVEERLLAGYRYCGCPEAQVHATCADGRTVHVQIAEGSQYRNGQVEIAAPEQVDRAAIVRCLTTLPQRHEWSIEQDGADLVKSNDDAIAWKPGDPIHYDEWSIANLKAAARRALAEQGFARCKFELGLAQPDASGNVNLRLQIAAAPEPERIHGIEIVGLKRNTREELLQFVHVAQGDVLNAALLDRVYTQLRECCRFWTYQVSAVIPGDEPKPDHLVAGVGNLLKIELDEYGEVPPLGKPLPEVDEVLRKSGLLLASPVKTQDFVVEASRLEDATAGIKAVRAVVGGDGRVSIEALSAPKTAWDIDHAILISPGALEIYDWRSQQKYVSPLPDSMTFRLKVVPVLGERGEYQMTAVVGASSQASEGGSNGGEGPWQIQVEPVVALQLAHHKEGKRPKISVRNGELSYSDGHINLRLDAATGQLKELRCTAGNWIKRDFLVGRLEQGAFDKTASALRATGQPFQNRYDERHRIGSGWDFALSEIEKQPLVKETPELAMYCRLARQLRTSQTLALIWSRWLELAGEDAASFGIAKTDRAREFRIPTSFASVKKDEMAATLDNSLPGVPAMADLLFARGSWPWTISREATFWKLRERLDGSQAGAAAAMMANEFRRMAGGPVGPLGALALAESIKQLESGDQRQISAIGSWGASLLSQEAFLQDVKLTTDGDSSLAVACRAMTEYLGKLSDEEQQAVIAVLPDGLQKTAARIAKRRKEQPAEPPGVTIEATLLDSWNGGLRDVVAAELHEMETQVATSPDGKKNVK